MKKILLKKVVLGSMLCWLVAQPNFARESASTERTPDANRVEEVQQKKKKDKKEIKTKFAPEVLERIESKDYVLQVTTAMPSRGHSVSLSSFFSLGVKNDSVFSQLPYYGRAYRIPYGGGDGLNFNAPLKNYQVKEGKKGSKRIQFSSTTPEDIFNYRIEIYPNGNCFIDVSMQNRESIHFIGFLDLEKRNGVQRKSKK